MLPHRDSRLTRFVLIGFFIAVLAYAYFEGRGLLFGPKIEIAPRVMEVTEQSVTIQGHADRIVSLSMNGKAIPITEDGDFEEVYILAPGYNRVDLVARDRYGKTATERVEIIYTSQAPAAPSPTSTPSSTTPIVDTEQ